MTQHTHGTSLRRMLACVGAASLAFTAPAFGQQKTFFETDGIVAVEMESRNAIGDWEEETTWSGFVGDSYFRWDGPNFYGTPGNSIIRYDVNVTEDGMYNFRIRNRHNNPDASEENDVWVRANGQGPWTKIYSNQGAPTVNVWTWVCTFEIGSSHLNPEFFLDEGDNYIEFSGRSTNFMIDRFHLFRGNHPDGTNENIPQSPYNDTLLYCNSGASSGSCTPTLVTEGGYASVSGASDLEFIASNVPNGTIGLMLYGFQPSNAPLFNGSLCIGGQLSRSPVQQAQGSGGFCGGSFVLPFDVMVANTPLLLTPGDVVRGQFVFRDGSSSAGAGLTNAVRITVQN